MCGRFNTTDNPAIRLLMAALNMPVFPQDRIDVAPLTSMQFIYQDIEQRRLVEGIWSILIERNPNTGNYRQIKNAQGKPLSTFNAASRNLKSSRLWKPLFQNKRAIIPISGFYEWSMRNNKKTCFYITPADGSAIAMGAVYDFRKINNKQIPTAAGITLAGHPKFMHIHKQSIPLMLQQKDFDSWLDPNFHDVGAFDELLKSKIKTEWKVTPVDSPKSMKAIGESEIISADL